MGYDQGALPVESRLFTKLNDLKPQMIEEATRNASEVAEKFAQHSKSKLGKIRRAAQGQFSIEDRDGSSSLRPCPPLLARVYPVAESSRIYSVPMRPLFIRRGTPGQFRQQELSIQSLPIAGILEKRFHVSNNRIPV